MSTLHLEIVTPEGVAYKDDVNEVILPGIEGELGILPNHIPLLTQIVPGELRIKKGDSWSSFAAGVGFVEITAKNVKILTDLAITPEKISEEQVEEARKRAQIAMAEKELLSEEEFAVAAANLQKALAQLKIKRRRH